MDQLQLPMELEDAKLLLAMRQVFERRWARWHRCKRFEDAMADPVTRRLLLLTVKRGAATSRRDGLRHALG